MAKTKKTDNAKKVIEGQEAPESATPEPADDTPPPRPRNPSNDARMALAKKHKESRENDPGPDHTTPVLDLSPGESEEESEAEAERMRAELEAKAAAEAPEAKGEREIPEFQPYSMREVDGVQMAMLPDGREVPLQEVVDGYHTAAQKQAAATRAWQEASRKLEESKEYYRLAEQQKAPAMSEDQVKQTVSELNDIQSELFDARAFGDDEKAAQLQSQYNGKLVELSLSNRGTAQIDDAVVEQAVRRIRQSEQDRDLGNAWMWYQEQHKDIAGDPAKHDRFEVEFSLIHKNNPTMSPMELFQEAVKATRSILGQPSPAPAPGNDMDHRRQLKSAASTGVPRTGGVQRGSERVPDTPGQPGTVTEADMEDVRKARLKKIMAARGQEFAYGNAPISGPGGNRL